MVLATLVNGVQVKLNVRERSIVQTVMFFMVFFLKIKLMVKEITHINLANAMKVTG